MPMGMKTPNAIMVSMQEASAQAYQGSYSPVARQDIFSFCVGYIEGKPSTRSVPHRIGGATTHSRRIVVVGIAIVVDISEIGSRRSV
jgi:hypothetical protein